MDNIIQIAEDGKKVKCPFRLIINCKDRKCLSDLNLFVNNFSIKISYTTLQNNFIQISIYVDSADILLDIFNTLLNSPNADNYRFIFLDVIYKSSSGSVIKAFNNFLRSSTSVNFEEFCSNLSTAERICLDDLSSPHSWRQELSLLFFQLGMKFAQLNYVK